MTLTLPQTIKPVQLLAPAADAAGRTSAYISLKNCEKVTIVFNITQGNAATILLSLLQASAVAGTGSKVFANSAIIWSNLDTATDDVLTRRTDAVNYTTDAGVKNKVVVMEFDPSLLDVDNGFDCIAVSTGASNAANITSAMAFLQTRYHQSLTPTTLTD